mgnify:CR=1 FL=1
MLNPVEPKNMAVAFEKERNGKEIKSASEINAAKIEQLRTDPAFVARVTSTVQQYCKKETRLSRMEIPQRIYLCAEEWSPNNELRTAAMKLRRNNIAHFYVSQIEAMYAN